MKPVITVIEQMPKQYAATSVFDNETTADILIKLALSFVRKGAIEKHEANKVKQGSIINPHTGLTLPKGN